MYTMLAGILDVGPFNELYVEDREDSVRLNVRPAPFLDAIGNPIKVCVLKNSRLGLMTWFR